jgi:hypothetical protein
LTALACLAAPIVPVPDGDAGLVAGYVVAFAVIGALAIAVGLTVPKLPAKALALLVVPVGALGLLGALRVGAPNAGTAALVTASLLFGGSLLGGVVGRAIEAPGHILVVVVVSALVDVLSVLHPSGPSAVIVQMESVIALLALPFPLLGTDRIEPVLGVGDVIFAALYLGAAARHGLRRRRTVAGLGGGLLATMAVVLALELPIPALPFLGAGVLVAHPEARRLPPADRRKAATGLVLIVAVIAGLFLLR